MKITQTTTPTIDYKALFQTLPERYVVVETDAPRYTMIAANKAYFEVTGKRKEDIIGKGMFDVFPDNSPLALKTGKGELQRSFERVMQKKKPDNTGVIRYDIPDKDGVPRLRYWQATHYPVLDEKGEVVSIVQNTADVTEMVLTSEQLKINEQQFDEILATGLVGSWIWKTSEDIVHADKGLARLFGLNYEEIKDGLPLERFIGAIHNKDRERVEDEIEEALASKDVYESEYRTVDTSGVTHTVIARGRVQRDKTGKPVSFPGVIIDISDRKAVEHELQDSERRLRFMADAMPQLVWITRPDGYHEYYNAQWYAYTGTESGSTDGEGWNNLFHPDDQTRARRKWQHSLKTGEDYEIEYRLYHAATDRYRWVIGRALPMRDETGEIVKWYGTCTDIDDQKRMAQIQKFLADASKVLSSSLDQKKNIKKVCEMCVPDVADWCSVDLYDKERGFEQVVVAHADRAKVSQAIEYRKRNPPVEDGSSGVTKVMRTGKSEFYPVITPEMIEQYITDPDQRAYMKSLNLHAIIITPLYVHDKAVGAISFVSSDSGRYYKDEDLLMAEELAGRMSLAMTNAKLYEDSLREVGRRQQLEQELIAEKESLELRVEERTSQLQLTNAGLRSEIKKRQKVEKELHAFSKELERSNQELQDFAYVSSHDLQEPLRKIRAFGDLLQSEYADTLGEGNMYLERMQNAAGRMSRLIEDLLAFSRVSSKPIVPEQTELNTVLNEVMLDLETRVKETNATVEISPLPVVYADNTHMRQLFQNLIGNALKFHHEGEAPHVKVTYHPKAAIEEIRVSDNGIGFEDEYAEKIFAVFQRLHGKDTYEGTGIGLAVCRKIVERYGGTITAESVKNKGTTFIIRLPKMKGKE